MEVRRKNNLTRSYVAYFVLLTTMAIGCEDSLPSPSPEAVTLPEPIEAEACAICHPRQFNEWAGSSHNYGGGLDPTYQALEIGANYYQLGLNVGRVRDNLLCVSCHAPSATAYQNGLSNSNTQYRSYQASEVNREIEGAVAGEPLLIPPGRATELQQANDPVAQIRNRRLTYQGISCDSCHKVGRPLDDLVDENPAELVRRDAEVATTSSMATALRTLADRIEADCTGAPTQSCADALRAHCELLPSEPRCRRVSRGMTWDGSDFIEIGVSNLAHVYERETNVRYGQFALGDAASNIAHEVSHGATPESQAMNIAFEGQTPDVRPFLQTGLFCGGCHDVRLPPLPADRSDTTSTRMEPIHNEPFLRLENLYTEWFTSSLNLHPDTDPRDNPYLDENGNPRRVVCQDCHMSLYPFAPPGVYPGTYTASTECDDSGQCGEIIAVDSPGITRANLRIQRRERVTTHNMTGVDIGLGALEPQADLLGYSPNEIPPGASLPNQREANETTNPDRAAPATDEDYELPVALTTRRKRILETSATISLAGTPETIDLQDRDCSDGACCDERGVCNLPIKVWATNVNGGHNVAAGFSQERQMWVQLTVQDLGRPGEPVVDCLDAELSDFYQNVTLQDGRYPQFNQPVPHTALGANDVFNRMFGRGTHSRICRGMSGHLLDKPHHETREVVADGHLGDEDVFIHRIGNTVPELEAEEGQTPLYMASWHVLDLAGELQASDPQFGPRVGRPDQFHVPGNDALQCELSREGYRAGMTGPVEMFDPAVGLPLSTRNLEEPLPNRAWRVTDTSDERFEILYPFPEYREFLPFISSDSTLHLGERFGLIYLTNIFYSMCGCDPSTGSCVGPEEVTLPAYKDRPAVTMRAQVPWSVTYPALPSTFDDVSGDGFDAFHFPGFSAYETGEYFNPLMDALAQIDNGRLSLSRILEPVEPGTPPSTNMVYRADGTQVFTFVPLNSNHMPNNRALKFYKPQRHYYDIMVNTNSTLDPNTFGYVKGPIRVSAKLYYRHFPPEFLRLMARTSRRSYERAEAEGKADEYFPNGPLLVEGVEDRTRWPDTGDVDNVELVLIDEAVFYVDVPGTEPPPAELAALVTVPEQPTFAQHVKPILDDNCVPCHSDVLRHGGLVLDYDDFPRWDDAVGASTHAAQDPRLNLVSAPSKFESGRQLVVPGAPEQSLLFETLTRADPPTGVRRMPLKTDSLSPRDIETIRRWIANGAN